MPDENGFLTWVDFAGTTPKYEGIRIHVTDVDKVKEVLESANFKPCNALTKLTEFYIKGAFGNDKPS